eukprot:m.470024 g.470024  ORF g.470024 m.470024 type:complete len:234 (+) comp57095_c1_seq5:188-889(+)
MERRRNTLDKKAEFLDGDQERTHAIPVLRKDLVEDTVWLQKMINDLGQGVNAQKIVRQLGANDDINRRNLNVCRMFGHAVILFEAVALEVGALNKLHVVGCMAALGTCATATSACFFVALRAGKPVLDKEPRWLGQSRALSRSFQGGGEVPAQGRDSSAMLPTCWSGVGCGLSIMSQSRKPTVEIPLMSMRKSGGQCSGLRQVSSASSSSWSSSASSICSASSSGVRLFRPML